MRGKTYIKYNGFHDSILSKVLIGIFTGEPNLMHIISPFPRTKVSLNQHFISKNPSSTKVFLLKSFDPIDRSCFDRSSLGSVFFILGLSTNPFNCFFSHYYSPSNNLHLVQSCQNVNKGLSFSSQNMHSLFATTLSLFRCRQYSVSIPITLHSLFLLRKNRYRPTIFPDYIYTELS